MRVYLTNGSSYKIIAVQTNYGVANGIVGLRFVIFKPEAMTANVPAEAGMVKEVV
jgi:hypothetical protein